MARVSLKPNSDRIAVQQEVEKAISEGTLIVGFVNRDGALEVAEIKPTGDIEADIQSLLEEMKQQGVTFEVCNVIDGELAWTGDRIALFDLGTAIEEARAERTRFYTVREAVFGPSAWPGGAQ